MRKFSVRWFRPSKESMLRFIRACNDWEFEEIRVSALGTANETDGSRFTTPEAKKLRGGLRRTMANETDGSLKLPPDGQ
jgi:hypothetical protein